MSYDPTSPPTRLPAIPDVPPGEYAEVLQAIKEILEIRVGARGNRLDSELTFRQLVSTGFVRIQGSAPAVDEGFADNTQPASQAPDYSGVQTPPVPTGLLVTPTTTSFFVSWDAPGYTGHAHTEVLVAPVDDSAQAVPYRTYVAFHAHAAGQPGVARYFWVRHVNVKGETGPSAAASATAGKFGSLDLADAAVEAQNLVGGSVVPGKLGPDSVLAENITLGSVIGDKLAEEAVQVGAIVPEAVTNAKLAVEAVTAAGLADGAVQADKILAEAVETEKLEAGAVVAGLIAGNAVTADKLDAASIGADAIDAEAVVAGKLAANAIVVGDGVIANLAITNALIGNATIEDAKFGTLTGEKILVDSVDGDRIVAGTITAATGAIADAAVDTLQLSGEAVTVPRSAFAWNNKVVAYDTLTWCPPASCPPDGQTIRTVNWETVASESLDTGGQPVLVVGHVAAKTENPEPIQNEDLTYTHELSGVMRFRFYCSDGTYWPDVNGLFLVVEPKAWEGAGFRGLTPGYPISAAFYWDNYVVSWRHTPGAGAKTYYLQVGARTTSLTPSAPEHYGRVRVNYSSLVLRGLKR